MFCVFLEVSCLLLYCLVLVSVRYCGVCEGI
jgi:hypothetical protein